MTSYKPKILNVGDVFEVVCINVNIFAPRSFYAVSVEDYNKYIYGLKSFSEKCSTAENIGANHLKFMKPVVYKSEEMRYYQRALILEVINPGLEVSVYLIDTGQTKHASIAELKKIPCMKYLEEPGIAFLCQFDESHYASGRLSETFQMREGYYSRIKILDTDFPFKIQII